MKKTAIEAVNIVFLHLQNSSLFTDADAPTGDLYRYQRLQGSQLEDVVVNSLVLNREFVQKGVLNVNVYVPNLALEHNGSVDSTQANTLRLTVLAQKVEAILQEVWASSGTYQFEVQQDNIFPDENNQHYINFRVLFRHLTS